jgi:hypothetical protein
VNLVIIKAVAKQELFFNKLAFGLIFVCKAMAPLILSITKLSIITLRIVYLNMALRIRFKNL